MIIWPGYLLGSSFFLDKGSEDSHSQEKTGQFGISAGTIHKGARVTYLTVRP